MAGNLAADCRSFKSAVTYSAPQSQAFIEYEEKRSRFITYLEPVSSRAQALEFLESLRLLYPDARHHCWVYVVGDPASAIELAFSDDGEPSGTAAKPMLNVLQHRGVGNCMAVVVRYFGGVKLGAGGLVRAYSTSISQVVDAANLKEYVPHCEVQLLCDFDQESQLRHWLIPLEGVVVSVEYSANVALRITLPSAQREALLERLELQGGGRMQLAKNV